jgi:hypothetical protein
MGVYVLRYIDIRGSTDLAENHMDNYVLGHRTRTKMFHERGLSIHGGLDIHTQRFADHMHTTNISADVGVE